MKKKITIEGLAQMTARGFADVETRLKDTMKQGFQTVLEEINGLRGDIKIWHQDTR